jgi:hypothetical protein
VARETRERRGALAARETLARFLEQELGDRLLAPRADVEVDERRQRGGDVLVRDDRLELLAVVVGRQTLGEDRLRGLQRAPRRRSLQQRRHLEQRALAILLGVLPLGLGHRGGAARRGGETALARTLLAHARSVAAERARRRRSGRAPDASRRPIGRKRRTAHALNGIGVVPSRAVLDASSWRTRSARNRVGAPDWSRTSKGD